MLKVLVPVDGSDYANRALEHLLKLRASNGELEIHLLNVQIPIDSGHARMFVTQQDVDRYHREEGLASLAGARQTLDAAGVPYQYHIAVGRVADTIVRYAVEQHFDKIVMGTHGQGGMLQALLGSVAHEVLERSPVPVTLINPAPKN